MGVEPRWCVPSALTLGALLLGLSAVRFASEGAFHYSVACVMFAAVLDGLDGHVARAINACTEFGFELDSLCDLANFGVSPALIVYFWGKDLPEERCSTDQCWGERLFLWLACCAYAACCACRLARFNVGGHAAQMDQQYSNDKGKDCPVNRVVVHNLHRRKMYFRGVPAPVGAAYALTPIMFSHSRVGSFVYGGSTVVTSVAVATRNWCAVTLPVALIIIAGLMVSTLPTLSSKMLKTEPNDSHLRPRGLTSGLVKLIMGLVSFIMALFYTCEVFLACSVGHILSIPVGVFFYWHAVDKSD